MNRFVLLLVICCAGCYSATPSSKPASVATANAVVFERLAVAVERGEFCDSTQRFVKVAGATLNANRITPPKDYDAALTPWLNNHQPSDTECKEMAAKLRGMK